MEIIKDVKLFKEPYFRNEWEEFLGSYDLQIIGNKARVIQHSIFGKPNQSRLNYIRPIGSIRNAEKHIIKYHIIVNGLDAYFKIDKLKRLSNGKNKRL